MHLDDVPFFPTSLLVLFVAERWLCRLAIHLMYLNAIFFSPSSSHICTQHKSLAFSRHRHGYEWSWLKNVSALKYHKFVSFMTVIVGRVEVPVSYRPAHFHPRKATIPRSLNLRTRRSRERWPRSGYAEVSRTKTNPRHKNIAQSSVKVIYREHSKLASSSYHKSVISSRHAGIYQGCPPSLPCCFSLDDLRAGSLTVCRRNMK